MDHTEATLKATMPLIRCQHRQWRKRCQRPQGFVHTSKLLGYWELEMHIYICVCLLVVLHIFVYLYIYIYKYKYIYACTNKKLCACYTCMNYSFRYTCCIYIHRYIMFSLFLSLIETLVERGGWMMTFLAKPGRCHLGLTNATRMLFCLAT